MNKNLKIYEADQNTDQWLIDRSGHFTASKANELLMKSTNKGYQDLISRIAIERLTGIPVKDNFISSSMQRGNELENEARQAFEEQYFCKIKEYGFIELDEWVGVSIDGEKSKNELIEIKCLEYKAHSRLLLGTEEIERRYIYQIQFQLWVTGAEICYYFSYYPGIIPFISGIKRDEIIIKSIKENLEYAIEDVEKRIKLFTF